MQIRSLRGFAAIAVVLSFLTANVLAAEPKTLLKSADVKLGEHHLHHFDTFGQYTSGYNLAILRAIDKVQATAMDGGGYFIGVKANPPESPIGYELKLFGKPLLSPPRTTSYCSGASCTVFVEAINQILDARKSELSADRFEALRMQEPDGSRRNDGVKFWGHWNDDGFGTHYALVQYTQMGEVISPNDAQPGDFVNISWKSGVGHSVVFLGWYQDEKGQHRLYFSSQKGTNGLGDALVSLEKIKEVKFVRLTSPEKLLSFDPAAKVERKIGGDTVGW